MRLTRCEPEKEWLLRLLLRFNELRGLFENFHVVVAADFITQRETIAVWLAKMRFAKQCGRVSCFVETVWQWSFNGYCGEITWAKRWIYSH